MSTPLPNGELPVIGGATCQHLRSKGMYISGERDLGNMPIGDGNCWCGKTQQVLGPDDQLVGRDRCSSARRCYVAVLS
ncbi:MAG: hypothetical protein AB7O62_09885 [Pirellulales bacterium]